VTLVIASIKVDQSQMNKAVLEATKYTLNEMLRRAVSGINRDIHSMIDSMINGSFEAKSIVSGELQHQLEIKNGHEVINDILTILSQSVTCTIVPMTSSSNSLKGGLKITVFKDALEKIINLQSGIYQTKFNEVPWLRWLLTQGDSIIIFSVHTTANNNTSPANSQTNSPSQSGIAKLEAGGGWRIPPQFAGTEDSNWITKTFAPLKIKDRIVEIVKSNLGA